MDDQNNANGETSIILHHQRAAFDRLTAIARVCFTVNRQSLPVRLRTNSLIAGPSGSGKTFLAGAVAREMGVPFLSIAVSEWVLIGTSKRGGPATWPRIHEFLSKCKRNAGAIIFIDEIDKLNHGTGYEAFLIAELFGLLDCRIPSNLNDSAGDCIRDSSIAEAQEVLSTRTLLLAGGAFQDIWDSRSRPTMGFLKTGAQDSSPDLLDLSNTLPRELVNRFRSDVVILPSLIEEDYRQMLDVIADKVPVALRQRFTTLGQKRIQEACRLRQGTRFMEELLLDTILDERAELVNCRKVDLQPDFSIDGLAPD